MEHEGKNMQDIRNIRNVKLIRWKVEKLTLEGIGHVLRMDSQRPLKIAVLGWLTELQKVAENPREKTEDSSPLAETIERSRSQPAGSCRPSPRQKEMEEDDQGKNDTFTKIREKKITFPQ